LQEESETYKRFKKYVLGYMRKLPQIFNTIKFMEFDEKGYDLKSEYENDIAIFYINIKEVEKSNGDIKWLAKMAIMLLLDHYFNADYREKDSDIDENLNLFCQAITFLIK
jgi:hypothetical protein